MKLKKVLPIVGFSLMAGAIIAPTATIASSCSQDNILTQYDDYNNPRVMGELKWTGNNDNPKVGETYTINFSGVNGWTNPVININPITCPIENWSDYIDSPIDVTTTSITFTVKKAINDFVFKVSQGEITNNGQTETFDFQFFVTFQD